MHIYKTLPSPSADLKHKDWVLYTDGGSKENLGGYGVHGYIHDDVATDKKIHKKPTRDGYNKNKDMIEPLIYINAHGGYRNATNNQMEIQAMYMALYLAVQEEARSLTILSDSDYTIRAITQWYKKWESSGWVRPDGTEIKNKNLLMRTRKYYDKARSTMKVNIVKVSGHSGEYGNDRADALATFGRISHDGSNDIFKVNYDGKAEPTVVAEGPKEKIEMNPIFSKAYFYATTNIKPDDRLSNDGRYVYHLGKHTGKIVGATNDPDVFLGKPTGDHSYAVVLMNEPDTVAEHIMTQMGRFRHEYYGIEAHELIIGNLRVLKRPSVYKRYFTDEGLSLELTDKRRLTTHDGHEIARVVDPPLIAFSAINFLNSLEWILEYYLNNKDTVLSIDLTNDIYQSVTNNKGKTKYNVHDGMNPGWKGMDVNTECPYKGTVVPVKIRVLADMDLPDRNALSKLAGPDTKVTLILMPESVDAYQYYIIVETSKFDAIFSSVHSNRVFLKE